MTAGDTSRIDAGPFGEWLAAMRAVLRGERDADVPCGDCVGCCVSSYPIPLRPRDEVARAQVPEQMLIGAALPGRDWLMGYRDDGSCPFFAACSCSIYAHRPQTCRDYDCRIYAATGLLPDGNRPLIQQRVRSWQFECDSAADRAAAAAVRSSAQFIREHAGLFPPRMRAASATAASVLAVKTYEIFLSAETAETAPDETVRRVIGSAAAFDRRQPLDE
jgi:hypothetical protein